MINRCGYRIPGVAGRCCRQREAHPDDSIMLYTLTFPLHFFTRTLFVFRVYAHVHVYSTWKAATCSSAYVTA